MDCFSVLVRLDLFLGDNLFRNWGVAHRAEFVPAGVPAAMIERINHEVAEAITSRAIREILTAQLMEPIPDTPAQFRARIDADLVRWAPVIEAANIKIN
jgi:tripartite-type tricarboxylate transporter receptor subunit TctC